MGVSAMLLCKGFTFEDAWAGRPCHGSARERSQALPAVAAQHESEGQEQGERGRFGDEDPGLVDAVEVAGAGDGSAVVGDVPDAGEVPVGGGEAIVGEEGVFEVAHAFGGSQMMASMSAAVATVLLLPPMTFPLRLTALPWLHS